MTKFINTYINNAAFTADTNNFSYPHVGYLQTEDEVKYNETPGDFNNIWGTVTDGTTSFSLRINNSNKSVTVNNGYFMYNWTGGTITSFREFLSNKAAVKTVNINMNGGSTNVNNLYHMFYKCSNITEVNVSGLTFSSDISNVQGMFEDCSSLTEIPQAFRNIDCTNINNIQGVFDGCSSLAEADLSGWVNVNKGSDLIWFFRNCKSLTTINVSGWDTSNMELPNSITPPTYGCTALRTVIMNNTNEGTFTYWKTALQNSNIASNVTITRDGYNWNYVNGQWVSTPV